MTYIYKLIATFEFHKDFKIFFDFFHVVHVPIIIRPRKPDFHPAKPASYLTTQLKHDLNLTTCRNTIYCCLAMPILYEIM